VRAVQARNADGIVPELTDPPLPDSDPQSHTTIVRSGSATTPPGTGTERE
jgi:hypothetical protein